MKFIIFGSGFGLYGYIPALIKEGNSILLPELYKEKFSSRAELQPFKYAITWFIDMEPALREAEGVVVAKRPIEQPLIIEKIINYSNIKYLLLEKPLAITPRLSLQLLDYLKTAQFNFRIAYLFVYTKWSKILQNLIKNPLIKEVCITWKFMAHHFSHNLDIWKRYDKEGGGVIRFYGIQAIALMALLKYNNIVDSYINGSLNQSTCWNVSFKQDNGPLITWLIDSHSRENIFMIESCYSTSIKKEQYINRTPFDDLNSLDMRCGSLQQHIQSLFDDNEKFNNWYYEVSNLHHLIERDIFTD